MCLNQVSKDLAIEPKGHRFRLANWVHPAGLPAILLLLAFFFVPMIILFTESFSSGWTTSYSFLMEDSLYFIIMGRTLSIAGMVTVVCLVIGYPVAFFLFQAPRSTRYLGLFIILIPFWTSQLVRTYAWMIILGRRGIINESLLALGLIERPLVLLNTTFAVVVGMVHVMLPMMILPLFSAMNKVDRSLLQAASGLGAGPLTTAIRVFLPLTANGILAGCTVVFVVSIGIFVTPALLGGGKVPVLSVIIEQQIQLLNWDTASALSVVLLAATLLILSIGKLPSALTALRSSINRRFGSIEKSQG